MKPQALSIHEERILADELLTGESILWTGKPEARVIFHKSDWVAIPFSLMWGGFAIFWEWGVSNENNPSMFMKLWGIPFVVIGQYFIWGRFIYDAWLKRKLIYAVTDQRVLVVRYGSTTSTFTNNLDSLPAVSVTSRQDGIGSIEFSEAVNMLDFNTSRKRKSMGIELLRLAFLDIENARDVYRLIQDVRRKQEPLLEGVS